MTTSIEASESTEFLGKRCSLLRRRPDMDRLAFRRHWVGPHAAIAIRMPGIAHYTQNRLDEPLWQIAERSRGYEADGIVELEFRDERSMQEANAGPVVREMLPPDELRFLEAITLCQVPAGAAQIRYGLAKVMLALRFADAARDGIRMLAEAIAALGCVAHTVESVAATFHRTQLQHESEPPDVFATLWFDDAAGARAALAGGAWPHWAGRALRRGTAWLCDPLPIVLDGKPCDEHRS